MHSGKITVINLFGAPGVGKSAQAAGLFWLMKMRHMSVELVSEYAKYLVLTDREWQIKEEQIYLLAKQHHKQHILRGKYEFCISDSPLLLCSFYAPQENTPPEFHACAESYWQRFENMNFFLTREIGEDDFFEETGRIHGKRESAEIEQRQRAFLSSNKVPLIEIKIDDRTPWVILDHILSLSEDPGISEPALDRIALRESRI